MDSYVINIINELNNSEIINKLKEIKKEIKNDKNVMELINKFNLSKEAYELYGYDKDFIQNKINLMQNELIKRYLEIQNEINLLSIYINKKIEEITKNTTCNK